MITKALRLDHSRSSPASDSLRLNRLLDKFRSADNVGVALDIGVGLDVYIDRSGTPGCVNHWCPESGKPPEDVAQKSAGRNVGVRPRLDDVVVCLDARIGADRNSYGWGMARAICCLQGMGRVVWTQGRCSVRLYDVHMGIHMMDRARDMV